MLRCLTCLVNQVEMDNRVYPIFSVLEQLRRRGNAFWSIQLIGHGQVLLDRVIYMNQEVIIFPSLSDMTNNLIFRHVTAI